MNATGEQFWVKYHFKTNQGVHNLSNELAAELAGKDTDYLQNDLFDAIETGDHPSWTVAVQLVPYEAGLNYPQDIFDVTKVISQKDYPLIEIGQMVLDENPTNNFEDIEELAFSPANLVPGIEASPDKLLQGRLFGYKDAERYRLGANYEQLPVNRPKVPVHNYERDGIMAKNQETGVNYEPNSEDGPKEVPSAKIHGDQLSGQTGNYPADPDYYSAADKLYNLLTDEEQDRLIENIRLNLGQVTKPEIQIREVKQFYQADPEYGRRVATALNLDLNQFEH